MKRKMKFIVTVVAVICFVGMALAGCGGGGADESGVTVIKGNIYTADKDGTTVGAVAIKDGKYEYVGDAAGVEEYESDAEVIELKDGEMVIPSFADSHAHGVMGGVGMLYEVNLYEGDSLDSYLDIVKAFIADHDDLDFIYGMGWINGVFPKTGPTAKELDTVTGDLPCVLMSEDGHSSWANTKAMEMAGVDKNTKTPAAGVIEKDADGNPSGTFREAAQGLVAKIVPEYTVEQYREGILAYQKEAIQYGLTSFFEPLCNEDICKAYSELDSEGQLTMKVFGGWNTEGAQSEKTDISKAIDKAKSCKEKYESENFKLTSVKVFADGVVEGKTAYLIDDYADQPGFRGEPTWSPEELDEIFKLSDEAGFQIHVHSIGDAATQETMDAFAKLDKDNGSIKDKRNAITHLQVVDPKDIDRMAEYGIIADPNPYWFYKEAGYFDELEVPFLGEKRANSEYPMKSFYDTGLTVSCASDYPVTIPAMPLQAIQVGVTRCDPSGDTKTLQNPDQRVTVQQMIQAATYNGAYAQFAEDDFGSIEKGKSADFLILGSDITAVDPFNIGETPIINTYFKGDVIYSKDDNDN